MFLGRIGQRKGAFNVIIRLKHCVRNLVCDLKKFRLWSFYDVVSLSLSWRGDRQEKLESRFLALFALNLILRNDISNSP